MIRKPNTALSVLTVVVSVLSGCHAERSGSSYSTVTTPSSESRQTVGGITTIRLEDVAQASAVNHINRDGQEANLYCIVEAMAGGTGVFDYDANGFPDIFLLGGGGFDVDAKKSFGLPSELYRNFGHWRYSPVGVQSLAAEMPFYPIGVCSGDLNEDGLPDMAITGIKGLRFLFNNGDGTFRSINPVGVEEVQMTVAAGIGDLNGDGLSDLYVTNYCDWSFDNHPYCKSISEFVEREVCGPRDFKGLPDLGLFNDGQGEWLTAPQESGLRLIGKGLGVLLSDFNGDCAPDVFVANDTEVDFLLLNKGKGKFQERGLLSGVGLAGNSDPNGSMGIAWGDYNNDGMCDLLVSAFHDEMLALMRQKRPGQFFYSSPSAGLTEVGDGYSGWGVAFADLDLDGWLDLVVVNGDVYRAPPPDGKPHQVGFVYHNQQGVFKLVTEQASPYLSKPHLSHGLSLADFDDDGLPDVLVNEVNMPPGLLANRSARQGVSFWLELIGTKSTRIPVGAQVRVFAGNKSWTAQVFSGGSYASCHQQRLFFGLGKVDGVERVEVQWPSGITESWSVPKGSQGGKIVEQKNDATWYARAL